MEDENFNPLGFGGRTVPEVSLINEDAPPRRSPYSNGNDSNNQRRSRMDRSVLPEFIHSSPPGTPFVPSYTTHNSFGESMTSLKLDNMQLNTLCRKNDDLMILVREQQTMIRDLKQNLVNIEQTVQSLQSQAASSERVMQVVQNTAREVQNIPREAEIRQIVQEMINMGNGEVAKMFQHAVISLEKSTVDKEVQAAPEMINQAVQSQTEYARESTKPVEHEVLREVQNLQVVSTGRNDEHFRQPARMDQRQYVRSPNDAQYIDKYTNLNPHAVRDTRERIVEGQPARQMHSVRARMKQATSREPRYLENAADGPPLVALKDVRTRPTNGVQERENWQYGSPVGRMGPTHQANTRRVDHEELDYYPERGSPAMDDYYDMGDCRRVDRVRKLKNEAMARNTENPHRSEESLIANQFVAKYLGAERLNKLQRPPPRPPSHRRTILRGNVSFAQFAVATQYPDGGNNEHMRDPPLSPPYVGGRGRYPLPQPPQEFDDDDDDEYDSWDDMPQGVPVAPSERILDLTAIYSQPAAL